MRIHDRIETAFEAWGRFVFRNRVAVAAACLLASLGVASFAPQLQVDNSTESLLQQGDPARDVYDAFRAQFGQDDRLMVAIRPPEVFDLGFLARLRALHRDIEDDVPYVAEVTSLWNARNTRGEADELIVEDLLERWPEDEAELAVIRERVLGTPAYRNSLVNPDGTVTTILIEPVIYSAAGGIDDSLGGFEEVSDAAEPEFLTESEEREMVTALREVVERHRAPDLEIHMAGGGIMNHALTEALGRDVSVSLTIGVFLMSGILFALFRRLSGVLLPVALVLLCIVVNYGAMALIGIPTSLSGQVLPVLVLVVGISGTIHILAIVYKRLGEGRSREDAIADALAHSGLAVFMAAATTAAGLVSFSLAGMAQVANLGRAAPIGVMLTFVYSVTLLPAVLALVPLRASRYGGDAFQRRLARGLARVGDVATARPKTVLLAAAAIAGVAGVGVAQLSFSQNGMRWFPDDDPNKLAAEFLDAHMGGAGGVEVWVDTGRENGLHDPELMRRLDAAIADSYTLNEGDGELFVGATHSVVELVKETHQALNENRGDFYALPAERQLLAQELLLFENSGAEYLEDFVDPQLSQARVMVHTPFADGVHFVPFLAKLEAGFEERLGEGVEVTVTGIGALMGRTFSILNVTMANSYAIALVVITPLMVLLIGDLRRGLLSMIPNLLPIWLTLGLMGGLGIPLDNSTLLVGCVLIGLAVDDTIHFMHKFQRYYALRGSARWAVRDTLQTTGAALFFTTLVLTAGFLTMCFGYMKNGQEFGMLATFAAASAFLADLWVAPALMTLASRSTSEAEDTAEATAA